MKKKLTEYEKDHIEWEKADAQIEVLLVGFDKFIKYDYTMPSSFYINKMVKVALEKLDLPKYIKEKISDVTWSSRDEYSKLEYYMSSKSIIGHEWFCGYGDFYRWRPGENTKAWERINKYIPKKDMKYYIMVQDYLRKNVDKHKDY